MQIVELNEPGDIAPWAGRWRSLAEAAGARYFGTPEWVSSWWSVCEPACRLVLLVDGPLDAPTGILPLGLLRRRLHPRVPMAMPYLGIAGAGFGAADALGPLTADPESARRLLVAAADHGRHLPLVLDSVAPRHRAFAADLPGATVVSTRRRPVVDLSAVDDPGELWSAKTRKNVRRRERVLAERGITRRWVRLDASTSSELAALERLHLGLWESRGREGIYGSVRTRFFADLCEGATADAGPWLQVIESDGRALATLFGFRFGATFCSYKTGWDPAHQDLGLGVQLHAAALRWAKAAGAERYDFLRGPAPHKYALGGRDEIDTTIVLPRGPIGRPFLWRDRLAERRSRAATWQGSGE